MFSNESEGSFNSNDVNSICIQKTVPADRLLIWNLKDGWEPLCKFLNKAIPDFPVPRDNKTGDSGWMDNYLYDHEIWKEIKAHMPTSSGKILLKIVFFNAGLFYLYTTSGEPLFNLINAAKNFLNLLI